MVEGQAHRRYYNSVRWGDSYDHTARVAVCQRARSVQVPVLIEPAALSQAVRQKLSSHHHAEILVVAALQLQQDLVSAVRWERLKGDPGTLAQQ